MKDVALPTEIYLSYFGRSIIQKLVVSRFGNELVCLVKSDEGDSMYLSQKYVKKVLSIGKILL